MFFIAIKLQRYNPDPDKIINLFFIPFFPFIAFPLLALILCEIKMQILFGVTFDIAICFNFQYFSHPMGFMLFADTFKFLVPREVQWVV